MVKLIASLYNIKSFPHTLCYFTIFSSSSVFIICIDINFTSTIFRIPFQNVISDIYHILHKLFIISFLTKYSHIIKKSLYSTLVSFNSLQHTLIVFLEAFGLAEPYKTTFFFCVQTTRLLCLFFLPLLI